MTDKRYPRNSEYKKDGIGLIILDPETKEELGKIDFIPEPPEWEAAHFFLYMHDNYLEPEPDPTLLMRYNRIRRLINYNHGWWMNPNKVLDAKNEALRKFNEKNLENTNL